MKVTKEVTFDSAHMLSNYRGKCSNLHGHTYKLQVTLEGTAQREGNEEYMVMDFNTLKQVINTVVDHFDHALIFSDEDQRNEAEDALMEWANKFGMNYMVIEGGKSTSECIALDIKTQIECACPRFNVSVKLWETPTSFVEV